MKRKGGVEGEGDRPRWLDQSGTRLEVVNNIVADEVHRKH